MRPAGPASGGTFPGPPELAGGRDEPSGVFDDEGVDRSLVRESLRRSPAERLDLADGYAQEIEALRGRVRGRRDAP